MAEDPPLKEKAICANCGAKLHGRFCSKCGEKRLKPSDFAFSHLLKELFENFSHADSRLLRSLWYVVRRPGFLSAEYLNGRRKPYLKPLSFFLLINVLYFLTIPFSTLRTFEAPLKFQYMNPYGKVAKEMVDARTAGMDSQAMAGFEEKFNHENHSLSKSLLIILAPLLALPLWMLFGRRKPYFAQHFVVALHFLSLQLLLNIVFGIVLKGGVTSTIFGFRPEVHFFIEVVEPLLWFCLLGYVSFKTVYEEKWPATLSKTMVMVFLWFPILILYRFLIFLLTLVYL